MKITIESTTEVVLLSATALAVPIVCRVWEGLSEGGVKVQCLIPRIAVSPGEDTSVFDAELIKQRAPSAEVRAFPLRMIL
jgi:hypothetical protein